MFGRKFGFVMQCFVSANDGVNFDLIFHSRVKMMVQHLVLMILMAVIGKTMKNLTLLWFYDGPLKRTSYLCQRKVERGILSIASVPSVS